MKVVLTVLCVLMSGCASSSFRAFQKTVPAPPSIASQVESWREASSIITQETHHPMALALSQSLGLPQRAVTIDDSQSVMRRMREEAAAMNEKNAKIRDFLYEHGGKEIEGTGIDLMGLGFGTSGLIIVLLCVFLPGFSSVLFFVIRRLGATTKSLVSGIERFLNENPDAGSELKAYLSMRMDSADKARIQKIRRSL